MKTIRRNSLWVAALLCGICLGAAAMTFSQATDHGLPVPATHSPSDLSTAFREVASTALPAVVSIETYAKGTQVAEGEANPLDQEMFRRFFGNDPQFEQFFQAPRGETPPRQGRGSGFIVDASGVVLTNSHVVDGAERVTVHLNDGRQLRAVSWVSDPRSDVAIIRVEPEQPLPTLLLGDSDAVDVGDWVLAMGNPFNVGTTVTAGIISAMGRGPGINERESYLQTDAAINPGNSGGPLVNLNGEVVGINTAISTSSGGYDGVGFAIPSSMVRWVADQLIADGTVHRSYLGVALQPMTNEMRQLLGAKVGEGALVGQVYPDTPAEKAGITELDVVVEFAGETIHDRSQLQGLVEALPVGSTHKAVVLRDGKRVNLDVTVEAMPGDFTPALQRAQQHEDRGGTESSATKFDKLGIEIEDLTDSLRERLGLESDVRGVVITSVEPNSPASATGLQAGVIIEKLGTKRVRSASEFEKMIEALSLDDGIILLVRLGDRTQAVVLKNDD